jgi:hypothetical protein
MTTGYRIPLDTLLYEHQSIFRTVPAGCAEAFQRTIPAFQKLMQFACSRPIEFAAAFAWLFRMNPAFRSATAQSGTILTLSKTGRRLAGTNPVEFPALLA